MPQTVAVATALAPLERIQPLRKQAKAALQSLKTLQPGASLADAGAHAVALSRLTRKEVAARLGVSESHLAGMFAGADRFQVEKFLADDVLRGPMLVALAMQTDGFDVITTITVRP